MIVRVPCRIASALSVNLLSSCFSLPNAFISRTPCRLSMSSEFIALAACRCFLYRLWAVRVYHIAPITSKGMGIMAIPASIGLVRNRIVSTPKILIIDTVPCSVPSIRRRSTAFTSSITRVIRSPEARLS